jgi:hypothetical protein
MQPYDVFWCVDMELNDCAPECSSSMTFEQVEFGPLPQCTGVPWVMTTQKYVHPPVILLSIDTLPPWIRLTVCPLL